MKSKIYILFTLIILQLIIIAIPCHANTSTNPNSSEGAEEACKACNALFQLGKSSLTASVFAISASAGRQGVPLPGLSQDYYLQAIREENLSTMDRPKRIYVKNELTLGQAVSTHLWMGDRKSTRLNSSHTS